jgi:UDP-4-amino-4,6-dideoxy-N-acetyl-beta-L-altrosamine transaminase
VDTNITIPYGRQEITEEDIKAVTKVLRSDWLTQGLAVPTFEQKLCEHTGAKYAVVSNSGTSALHLACLALNLGPGDILWTSPITFVASANCAFYCGASVDFVDVDPQTALISVVDLQLKLEQAEKIGKLPKIVVPVHLAGQPCDMKEIYKLGQQYGFKIIEDAAHALGASYLREPVGNCHYSDITILSFHPVKIITTGEGGAALTNDSELSSRMALLRSHGITREPNQMTKKPVGSWYYEQTSLGFNYRMTDIQAALGISQLGRLSQYVDRRREIADRYDEELKEIPVNPLVRKADRESSHHLYVIRVRGGIEERNHLLKSLRRAGIGANIHYIPIYRQPYFNGYSMLDGAEKYYENAISLPIFPTISAEAMNKVVTEIVCTVGKG